MYFHKNLVNAVINGLDLIIIEGKYADKVIFKLLKSNSKWGSRDRAFIAETIYEIIRWKRLYNEIIISINPKQTNLANMNVLYAYATVQVLVQYVKYAICYN